MKKLLFRSPPVYKVRSMVPTISRLSLRTAGIILLSFYLFAGVIYSFALPTEGRFSDEKEYLQLSGNLLHGRGYSMDGVHPTAMRPPGYPLFLTAIEAMGGGMVAMRIVQYFLFAGTARKKIDAEAFLSSPVW